jgi:hypothetical protein
MFEKYHSMAFKFHELVLIVCAFWAFYIAGPLWLLCNFLRSLQPAWPRAVVSQILTWAFGWLIIFAFLTFDPTTFSKWLLD